MMEAMGIISTSKYLNSSYCLGGKAAATGRILKERTLVLQDFWGVFSILIIGKYLLMSGVQ